MAFIFYIKMYICLIRQSLICKNENYLTLSEINWHVLVVMFTFNAFNALQSLLNDLCFSRPDLMDNYLALVLSAFISSGLLEVFY